jgi:hypothetical protein
LTLSPHPDEDAVGKEEYEDEFALGVERPKFTRPEDENAPAKGSVAAIFAESG